MRKLISIGSDGLIALGVGLAVFIFHAVHIPAVSRGAIFQKSNLAFDFDVDRFVDLWCVRPFPQIQNEAYYAVRHPLAISMRLLCMPLVGSGLDYRMAACGIAALCAALSTALVYRIARALDIQTPIACAFALLWSVSTTTLVLGVLPEAYGLALVALAYQFLLTVRWTGGHPASVATRVIVAVANFGITVTNIVLAGLTELFCRIAREPMRKALYGTVGFSIGASVLAGILTAASLSIWPAADIDSPKNAVRQMYWSATSYNPELRQDVANVAWEFGGSAFVAPAIARFPTEVPTNPYLWDFRGQNYSPVGWAAVLAWLALLAVGLFSAVRDRERWPIWAVAGVWILFNIGLHTYWQFRGSVFIYGAHPHIAFLMLALAGALRTRNQMVYAGAVLLVALLVAINNVPMYQQLASLN